jgi:hypothetical protein
MPEQKLDLLQFASGQMAQARATAAARRAAPFTTCQIAFGVMCSPRTRQFC